MSEQIEERNNSVYIRDVSDFRLKDIFECGQCFRWNLQADGSYSGVAYGRAVNVGLENTSTVVVKNSDLDDYEKIWKNYFDLKRDYGKIKRTLSANDKIMKRAVEFGAGIRILNQDEWETLISFILSQNRNIPLIKKSVELISQKFGKQIIDENGDIKYTFPEPEALAEIDEEALAECKLGYRAKYVIKTARSVAESPKKLYEMRTATYEDAFDYLRGLCGVGPKVANCVLLFSMEKYGSFPIDVWVRRVMAALYGADENDIKGIRDYSEKNFGSLGGFAQQYLFYYARENNIGK